MGVDSVLITAETPSSEPVNLAAELARDRAIVVAVGTVGMDLQRKLYYEKELDFRISRSYGPGRYDAAYEQKGRDYPIGHVRWTETRNLEAFLRFIADGKLNLQSLITHRFPMEQATRAYDLITGSTRRVFSGRADHLCGRRICEPCRMSCRQRIPVAARSRVRDRFRGSGRAGSWKFRAEHALTRAEGDLGRFFHRRLQCDRAAQPQRGGEIWIFLLFEFRSRTSAGSNNQRRADCHPSPSSRQPGAGGAARRESRLLRKAALPERRRIGFGCAGSGCDEMLRCFMVGFNRRFAPMACR